MQEEIWKDIDGFNSYQISNFGRIKSKERYVSFVNKSGKQCFRKMYERVLKYSIGTSGYPTTHLYTEQSERHTIMIHRLVAKHFIDPVVGKDFVNHKDGNKTNNHVSNLEWVTKSENTLHALDTGLLKLRGEDSYTAKLKEHQVVEIIAIRRVFGKKYSHKRIAEEYNVSEKYIGQLINAKGYWAVLKSKLDGFDLESIAKRSVRGWEPSVTLRAPSKHKITDQEKEEMLCLREQGWRICDIARKFNKTQKFISWYLSKFKNS